MTWLLIGLVGFLGIHSLSIVAPAWRDSMAARLGELNWKRVYSVASLVAFVALVHGCDLARQEPVVLYAPTAWMRHLAFVVMLPAFPLLLSAYLPGRIKDAVKHPMLAATQVWAVAHLLANGMLSDVLLFGGFLLWAVADRVSVARRPQRPARSAPRGRFNDAIAISGGLAVYVVIAHWAHARLFGVSLFP